MNKFKNITKKFLSLAEIEINGNNPWDIQVYNEEFYQKVLAGGPLTLGESYMAGWWDCKKLDEFFYRIIRINLNKKIKNSKQVMFNTVKAKIFNLQNKSKAFEIGKNHYDVGNELYENMLDKRLVYTCGYWKNTKNLDQAQEAKLDLICKKIGLKKGMKILDIGCGWGSFAKYAAEKYAVKVIGITVSKEQVKLGEKLCKGLPVEIRLQDYRDLNEKFDRIVSLGMFEHVGHKNYKTYMEIVSKCLKDDGLFLLQTIGKNKTQTPADPWIDKYIFPNGILPSPKQISLEIEGLFIIEDWHNFGSDYDKTVMAWYNNFNKNWNKIKSNYDKRFHKMWNYYLLYSAGSFRARHIQLWQIVFSKKGVAGGYESIR